MKRHPFIAFMLTPMAAPETPQLKRLRYGWFASCALLATSVGGIGIWKMWFGSAIAAFVFVLLIATTLTGFCYFQSKNRADREWAARGREQ